MAGESETRYTGILGKEIMENELRQFERVDKNFSIEISIITYPLPKDAEEEGVCRNISCGGICFTVPRPYTPESLLSLKMRIMGFDEYKKPYSRLIDIADQKPLTAIGQVVWCNKNSDSDYDIGVRFVNIYKDDYRALQKYLNNGKGTHSA
jgi:hypothetical protein